MSIKDVNQSPEVRLLIGIVVISLVCSFVLLLSVFWNELQYISHIVFFGIGLSFIFFLIRYPHFFSHAQRESQESRYLNSRLISLDKERVIFQLSALMDKDKIYRESSLTLKMLGEKVNISPAQLSELLNSHYQSSFNNYINSHRIEEIKTKIWESPDANILQTAFDCGFNSKTTFNAAFKKHTGLTPSQYREKKRSEL